MSETRTKISHSDNLKKRQPTHKRLRQTSENRMSPKQLRYILGKQAKLHGKCCNSRAMLRKLFTFICAMAGQQHSTSPNPNSSHLLSHHGAERPDRREWGVTLSSMFESLSRSGASPFPSSIGVRLLSVTCGFAISGFRSARRHSHVGERRQL